MELLDVVDENNNITGRQEDREIVHRDGLWHREVSIWIMNEKGELLLQRRAATKKQSPNKWAITGGHVTAGEEPLYIAKKEILEEIGLNVKEEELEILFITKLEKKISDEQYNNHFSYFYFIKTDKEVSDFIIQKEELSCLKYISIKEIEEIVKKQDERYVFSKGEYMIELISIFKNKEENL